MAMFGYCEAQGKRRVKGFVCDLLKATRVQVAATLRQNEHSTNAREVPMDANSMSNPEKTTRKMTASVIAMCEVTDSQ